MNMKLLLEAWNNYQFLEEEMVQPEQLPDNAFVFIEKLYNPSGFSININLLDQDNEVIGNLGNLDFGEAKDAYACQKNPYQIFWAGSTKGYGPLLYDIALELAGQRGLTSDKFQVSKEAARVWEYYYKNREDVKSEFIKCRGSVLDSRWGKDWPKEYPWLSSKFIKSDRRQLTKLRNLGKLRMML